jgi:hypothetical protein
MSKTSGGPISFVQIRGSNSNLDKAGVLDARQHERWRLRARVRYSGLDTNGARLKVQYFNSAGDYVNSSPVSTPFTGTSSPASEWKDVTLEFVPGDLIGADTFGRAEIMVLNSSNIGSIDVSYVSLEPLD